MRQPGGLHSDSIPELHVFEIAVGRSHLLPNRLEATALSGQERSNSPFRFIQIPIALSLPLLAIATFRRDVEFGRHPGIAEMADLMVVQPHRE
jgi:hypothetical protein